MQRVTLDTNCLIDLEVGGARAEVVRELVRRHRAGLLVLRIPAVIASERLPGGAVLEHFDQFKERLTRLGLSDLELLQPIAYYGIAFWGYGYWAEENMVALERKIHAILHPGIAFGYAEHCAKGGLDPETRPIDKKWRNAKCDVQIAWCHIHHGGTVLVTADEDFLAGGRPDALAALGAGAVIRTDEVIARLDAAA